MVVPAPSLAILQRLINTAVDNSKMEKFILQPTKSVILDALNESERGQEMECDINITMDGVKMSVVKEAMHMDFPHSADSKESAVNHNINKARRTT